MLYFKKLNREQKRTVAWGKGPLLIVAGAGTGKTAAITSRIAFLIEKRKAKPEEVLGVTFTEKAAEEMEERVDKFLPYSYLDLQISTFHSFCKNILEEEGLNIGLPSDFKLLDQTGAWLLVRQNFDKFKLDYYKPLGNPIRFIHALVSHFSRCKDQGVYPEDYLKYYKKAKREEKKRAKEVADAYNLYQKLLLENNFLDFGDLINYSLGLFQKRPLILKKYQKKLKYILVDEFQDTNWSQYQLVKMLAFPKNNLTVVADDDQCLPSNTIVDTKRGKKKINKIKTGDLVLTAVGKGYLSYVKVKRVFCRRKKARLLTFKTRKGYKIQVTDNHKMFCFTPRVSDKKYHYVYLMRRDNIGWRLGTTNDLAVRLKIERSADKILAIKSCQNEEETRFYETLYSLKYGIPTTCFKERDNVMVKGDWMIKLYKEINVEKGVKKLVRDLGIDLNTHHYSLGAATRGSSQRIKINLNMCKRQYKSKYAKNNFLANPLIYHQVIVETSNKRIIKKLKIAGFNLTETKKGYRFKTESKDIKKIGKIAEKLQRITKGILECGFVVGKTNIASQKALVLSASNVLAGLYLPVVTKKGVMYDQVKEVKTETKVLTVYDLEVERTHNFVANGVVVHNSIYKFRGASYNNILQFKKDFPKAKEIFLKKNYRSCQNILNLAYGFIQNNNPNRLEHISGLNKKLKSAKKEKGIIQHLHFQTFTEETEGVVNKIIEIIKKDRTALLSDFVILTRTNNQAVPFVQTLEKAGFSCQFLASRGLYYKPIILDIISYFKLLDNYRESSAFYRILNLDFLKIPLQDIMEINAYSRRKNKSIYESLQSSELIKNLSPRAAEKTGFLSSLIEKHTKLSGKTNVSEVFLSFLKDSGYLKYLTQKAMDEELNLLGQFYRKVKGFEETSLEPFLKNFMEQLNLELASGEQGKFEIDLSGEPETIKIMTIHSAKGLEFKYVFLVNLAERKFPIINKKEPIEIPKELVKEIVPEGDIHLEEERRLCYVAITRAKKGLFLTSAEDYGDIRKRKPSVFLKEIGLKKPSFLKSEFIGKKEIKKSVNQQKREKVVLPAYFSFSQLEAFRKCPLQYKYAHIIKIPARENPVYSFGKTLHNSLFEFVKLFCRKRKNLKLKDLLEIYNKEWIDEGYISKKEEERRYQSGKKALKVFYKNFIKYPPKILEINKEPALELRFKLKLGKDVFIGRIDRVDRLKNGVEIIDYKTGKSKKALTAGEKQQLLLYQIALEKIFKLKLVKLSYYYLEEGKKLSFLGGSKVLEEEKTRIMSQIREIKKKNFEPKAGFHCRFCDFKEICQYASIVNY